MLEGGDQAAGLRRAGRIAPLQLLAFPLGEGPAGWVAQLARALRSLGRRPVVLDAARGAVAGALGLKPTRHDLLHLLRGEREFDAVAQPTADGIYVLRGDRGLEAFAASGSAAAPLLDAFSRVSPKFDELLLAMPAAELACIASPARTVPVLVLDTSGASRMQAYAQAKQLHGHGFRRFACVVRGAEDNADAQRAHAGLAAAAAAFLGADVAMAGWLPRAPQAPQAALARTADTLLRTAAQPVAA
ncbi:MinD/ParA family ATP-binding protein [Ramlibacter humi]|uniref:Flagellar biosynthesis protein FlhG n=1 Tax=Ramlibacter humi TaxID=2530451 RepID=A0A4Z0CBH7_9BURK|nr:hypothetical protein [Ramlibacter humi]TFZ08364.1 hypothetical protein EZ216_04190 [Ramlibacter humi]